MATEQQLMEGLRRADAAGDTRSAQAIARELERVRVQQQKVRPGGIADLVRGSPAKPTDNSRFRGFVGGVLRPLDNLTTWASHLPGFDAVDKFGQSLGFMSANKALAKNDRLRANNSRTGWQAVGNVVGTAPVAYLPGGVAVQGAAGGALTADKPNDLTNVAVNATVGAVAGKVGQKVLAPLAERAGRTKVARKAAEVAVNRLNQARSAIPAKVRPGPLRMLPNPQMTVADRTVNKATPDVEALRQNLQDAARLRLPYSLADADPRLRMIAGSATRKAPEARALAERTLVPRARGQADRAVNAIDEHLAPVTDIKVRSQEIMDEGKPVYGPLYDEAYAAPAISSPRLDQVLGTPAGREAVGRANTIAANEFRDPKAMGFAVDDAGNVVLTPQRPMTLTSPGDPGGEIVQQPGFTTQSLDYVKRGIDDILEPQRNPITGKLNLDEGGKAINGVQRALLEEVDALNPTYRSAREAYGQYARQAEGLRTGHDVLPSGRLPQRDFDAILARQTDNTLPEVRRGYATAMADEVANRRLSANPYDAVYGSTTQQGKVASLFPEGAADFNRVYDLEGDMAKTATEVLGGSPTASRIAADQHFEGNGFADMALDTLGNGGVPSPGTAVKLGTRLLTKVRDAKMSQSKGEALAPTLLGTDPLAALQFVDQFARKQAEAEARRRAYEQLFTPFGVSVVAAGNSGRP